MSKTLPLLILGLVFLSESSIASDSLRCGTRLVQKYALAIQVEERCGDPISKELIGYTLQERRFNSFIRQREFKIEQWLYGPSNGYYTEIIFEAGRVREINTIKQ